MATNKRTRTKETIIETEEFIITREQYNKDTYQKAIDNNLSKGLHVSKQEGDISFEYDVINIVDVAPGIIYVRTKNTYSIFNQYGVCLSNSVFKLLMDIMEIKEPIKQKESQLKPFDKVLIRDNYTEYWHANFYSHYGDIIDYGTKVHVCTGGYWEQCIPYEGNEHLLGTKNEYEPDRTK